jgi:TonB family protein
MKNLCLILFLLATSQLRAQYLNKVFKETNDSSKVKYYCNYVTTNNGYIEKIFRLNDSLYSLTYLSSKEPKIREGKRYEYYENGGLKAEFEYKNDKLNGTCYEYYEDGKLECIKDYLDGKLNGNLKSLYQNGNLRRHDKYSNGELLEGKCYSTDGQDTAYFIYEQNAKFKNGDVKKFQKYVMSEVTYPEIAAEKGITGKVLVCFNVNSKGKVVDVEVIESPNYYLSKAAVDVILSSPDWEPGIQEGKKVKQSFVIPIIFQFQ